MGVQQVLYSVIWYFFLYSLLGWGFEVAFAAANRGAFVNRGFLNGPYCPIYGVGIVLAVYLLLPLSDNLPVLYIGSVLVISAVELLTGFLMKRLFHQRWWNYSHMKFNLGGYICLQASLGWGVAYMLIVLFIHPLLVEVVALIPRNLGMVLLALLSAFLAVDFVASVRTVGKLNRQLAEVDRLAAAIRKSTDAIAAGIAGSSFVLTGKTVDKLEELSERQEDRWAQRIDRLEEWSDEWEERREERADRLVERDQRADLPTDWYDEWTEEQRERREEIDRLLEQQREVIRGEYFGLKRLLGAFPHLQSIDYEEALELLRDGRSKPQSAISEEESPAP